MAKSPEPPVFLDIPAVALETIETLERELGCSGVLAQVLARRGLGDPVAAAAFLAAAEAHRPGAFRGMATAVDLVLSHIERRSTITVHGDYDCATESARQRSSSPSCANWEPTSTGTCPTARPRATGCPSIRLRR